VTLALVSSDGVIVYLQHRSPLCRILLRIVLAPNTILRICTEEEAPEADGIEDFIIEEMIIHGVGVEQEMFSPRPLDVTSGVSLG